MPIDHVVITVRDLARATADYRALGFTVTPGGEHADGATHNALIAFADGSYLELIAFKDPDRVQPHQWWPRLQVGEGLADVALSTDDLDGDATRWRARGLPAGDPQHGGRLRPDGVRIEWRSLFFPRPLGLPFILQDVTPHDLRVPAGAEAVHANGALRIGALTIVVPDQDAAARRYSILLDVEAVPNGNATSFTVAGQQIALVAPDMTRQILLERYGPCPVELALDGPHAQDFDQQLLHGVSLHIEATS